MRKLLKLFKIKHIDLLVFRLGASDFVLFDNIGYVLQRDEINTKKTRYFIKDDQAIIHSSVVFKSLHILKLINKKGPAIGDCFTDPAYRGRSIYPYVINKIAEEIFRSGQHEVFMIVNTDNASSIKGIEKAGFKRLAHIRCKRLLLFCFTVKITRY